jgi:Kae1-associated kinase Bud32
MPKEVVARGAEAVLYLEEQKNENGDNMGKKILVKERIKKGYRLPQIDEKIRKQRTKRETKMLSRAAGSGVDVPLVIYSGKSEIRMDFIDGQTVKEQLNGMPERQRNDVYGKIGKAIASLHKNGMVHGDLTTSNMILKSDEKKGEDLNMKLYIIDFGLGKFSQKIEDQAIDLFLLYEALKAAHYKYLNKAWQNILKIYKQNYSSASEILKRFEKISVRRRYK